MTDGGVNETTDQLQPVVFQISPEIVKLLTLTSQFDLSQEDKP